MNAPKRIAVDFDGTICDNEFPAIGKIKDGVRESLILFRELGYKVIIWSCRTCHWDYDVYGGDPEQPTLERDRVQAMIEWLDAHSVEYDEIDDGSKGKPGADYYLDDKAIRVDDNWLQIVSFIFQDTIDRNKKENVYVKKEGKLIPFSKFQPGAITPVTDATGTTEEPEGPYHA